MKRISVAMAVYNGAEFLPEQIDSILPQLKENDELVISYDPSRDNTWEMICDYAQRDPRVKVVKNDGAHGVIGNFNNALSHSTGDYVFICDQDDRWAENKRAVMMDAFHRTGADMIIHDGVHMDIEGKVISENFFKMFRIRPTDSALRIFVRPRYSGCTMAFTQDMMQRYLPIPPKTDGYDTWIAILSKIYGKVAYVDECLLYHRMHDNNATTKVSRPLSVKLKSRAYWAVQLVKRAWRDRKRSR